VQALVLSSLWLGAILLVPSGAHLLEMPRKLGMDRDAYFAIQQVYLGWALFGVPVVLKIGIDGVLAAVLWRRGHWRAGRAALASAALIGLGLAIFFVWVQPANLATVNWSMVPADWQALRQSWEYGHAAIAVLTLLAFGFLSYVVVLSTGKPARTLK
jgi:hypothetical protein